MSFSKVLWNNMQVRFYPRHFEQRAIEESVSKAIALPDNLPADMFVAVVKDEANNKVVAAVGQEGQDALYAHSVRINGKGVVSAISEALSEIGAFLHTRFGRKSA